MSRVRERDIDRLVDRARTALVDLATELIRCRPTYAEAPSGIARAQQTLASALRDAGMALLPVPTAGSELISHPLYVAVEEFGPNFADYRPGRHPVLRARLEVDPTLPTLALNGHIDVEPIDDHEWSQAALASGAVREGTIFGRGASDMLGALAAYAIAVSIVAELGGPAMNVEVHSVPDEELGGNGTLSLLEAVRAPEYVLIGEPTSLAVSEATLGFHHFVLEVAGRRNHMAENDTGEAAIELLAHAVRRIASIRPLLADSIRSTLGFAEYRSNPLAIGRIAGGTDPAVPPVRAVLEGAAFSAPGAGSEVIAAHLLTALDADLRDRSRLRFSRMSFPGNTPATDESLALAMAACLSDTGVEPVRRGFPSPCDLRLYSAYGSAGVVCGPGDLTRAHAPDEQLDISHLITYTKAIARLLLRFIDPQRKGPQR
jgi:acetylornithine deacetylase